MAKSDKMVGFRVEDEDLLRRFKAAAAAEGRSQQDVLVDAIREYVAKHGGNDGIWVAADSAHGKKKEKKDSTEGA
jgi:plasmid stability protein